MLGFRDVTDGPYFVGCIINRRFAAIGMIILDRWDFGEFEVDISPHILGLPTDFDAARKIVSFADFGGENGCRP